MYNVPKRTLKIHLNSSNIKSKEGVKVLGRCTIFYADIEMLENQILKPEQCFFGVTIRDFREAACKFAEQNNIRKQYQVKNLNGKQEMVLPVHEET